MIDIVLVVHNVRSTHNVGSLLRTADGLGVSQVILTGYTPYPLQKNDQRLPHISQKLTAQIHKTALGAEDSQNWRYEANISEVITGLKNRCYQICALEQTKNATRLNDYSPAGRTAIIVGSEVDGLEMQILDLADDCLQIPMLGKKESFNVAVAAAMALYNLRFGSKAVSPVVDFRFVRQGRTYICHDK